MLYESVWATQRATTLPDNLCGSCNGACCRDMHIPLKPAEAQHLRAHGTDLRDFPDRIQSSLNIPRGKRLYTIIGACGLFDQETNLCTAYDERPGACRTEVRSGDRVCQEIRSERLPGGQVLLPMPVVMRPEALPIVQYAA